MDSFAKLFERARAEGRIAPTLDSQTLAQVVATIGDGLFWRRAIDPNHDPKPLIETFLALISTLLNPIQPLDYGPPTPAAEPTKALV